MKDFFFFFCRGIAYPRSCTVHILITCILFLFKFTVTTKRFEPLFEEVRALNRFFLLLPLIPQWGAVDAEIKVPSGENTEL